ncbi:S-layer homology domain-containing protein [Alkaliphilus peptidifermentans]|uniref:Predicted glycosyl hydrolase n=1 Tax=Alkaliphilus peptidifermentans DSM 18978 TaxID=1120976 RepID=A0A1G5HPM4_9FIRM|nr:S-layer homology domain-containing protein [Alkaliphilus peptidifermentans]SCY65260.1 Predicted glycosyl hydrolase [Alkaliphilus peptidifermentans DSM 18978]
MRNNNRFLCFLLIILIFSTVITVFAEEEALRFNDVSNNHWAYEDVHELRRLDITEGIGNNEFGIGKPIKRNEFVTFLIKLMGLETHVPEEGSFDDNMNINAWYFGPIETALQHSIIHNDDANFRPEDPITREEMAIMIVRALGYDSLAKQLNAYERPFLDVDDNHGYIAIAKELGIVGGVGNNLFDPKATALREHAAAMMMRMYRKLNQPITELHGFYAIQSYSQRYMIEDLNSVSFGWSRFEYDDVANNIILNTTRKNNNVFAFPEGYEELVNYSKEKETSTQLMIFADNSTIIVEDAKIGFIEYMLKDAETRSQAIEMILEVIQPIEYLGNSIYFDGIVIDFEEMRREELSQSFNLFLQELRKELNQYNQKLYVALHPKRKPGEPYFDGYDYRTIGKIADKIILMAHDYNATKLTYEEMDRGYTTTPLTPILDIYYALKEITDKETGVEDINKIYIQLSFDSVQWKLKDGKVINEYAYRPTYEMIQKRLLDDVNIKYSYTLESPYVEFFNDVDETTNIVWYEDSRSITAKIKIAKLFGIQGLSFWRLGNIPDYSEPEDKNIYLDVWNTVLERIK